MADNPGTDLVPVNIKMFRLNKTTKSPAVIKARAAAGSYVPHLRLEEVLAIAQVAGAVRENGERNRLLVLTIFDGCLRVSEALALKVGDLKQSGEGWYVQVFGKGRKPGVAAISASLAAQLQAYAYRAKIQPHELFFPIKRSRAFQLIDAAMKAAGVEKPPHVGAVHVLRHSGLIERLRVTGNPKAVQEQARHSTAQMTLRYLKTLTAEEALKIQQQVDFGY
ncbi:tyrosine-type recombinase/integrase [Candidatus Magnetobacterium casense]|uniref:Site-specific integrase n=1 Tax=Candidatus Magnetobacterium casense TaxID=1455061 RepID=A0ABS6RXX6_9BACT|nr:site-specific integrase [Candidatus Magnetobacterium casensis]MBV6341480.1 site-specific integrase [Candidatus Magnetobacterium casensis]